MNAERSTSINSAQRAFRPAAMGHVIVSFANEWQRDDALRRLSEIGFDSEVVCQVDDPALIATIARDLTSHGLRNESWLSGAQCDFAELGDHWLVVRARSDGRAFQMADCIGACGATSVKYYGNLVVEELLERCAWPPAGDAARPRAQAERARLARDRTRSSGE